MKHEVIPDSDKSLDSTTLDENPEEMIEEQSSPSSWKEQKALLWQAAPLLILFLLTVIMQNVYSILVFFALICAFDSMNNFIKRQSEQSHNICHWKIGATLLYLVACIVISHPVLRKYWIFNLSGFTGWFYSLNSSFWSTIYIVTVVDFVIKFATMAVKCVILILSKTAVPVHLRGKMYMTSEGLSQAIRCLLPIPQWSQYILQYNYDLWGLICLVFLIIYVVLKLKVVKKKFQLVMWTWQYPTITGTKLQQIDIFEDENQKFCSICHMKHVKPMKLVCNHVFCHNCISLWFDRETFCPACNSESINLVIMGVQSILTVKQYTSSNSKWKTGTTDYVIQFF